MAIYKSRGRILHRPLRSVRVCVNMQVHKTAHKCHVLCSHSDFINTLSLATAADMQLTIRERSLVSRKEETDLSDTYAAVTPLLIV